MDVTWRIEPTAGREVASRSSTTSPPRVPGSRASSTAVHPAHRGPDARDVQGARRGAVAAGSAELDPPGEPAMMTARDASGSPGSGSSPRPAPASRRSGRACGRSLAGRSASTASTRPVPLAGRRPGRRLRPARLEPPKTARRLDRFSQFGLAAGRLALDDAGLRPAPAGAADPERIGIYVGSALGGIAYAEEQHERYLARGIRPVAPEPGAGGLRRRGARPTSGSRSTSAGRSCRPPTRARRGRSRSARRSATCATAGSTPRSRAAGDPAEPARVRGVRHHPRAVAGHNDDPGDGRPAVRCRPRRLRDGRRGRAARARGGRRRASARREPYAEVLGYGATSDATTWSSRDPTASRRPGPPPSPWRTRASSPTRSTT